MVPKATTRSIPSCAAKIALHTHSDLVSPPEPLNNNSRHALITAIGPVSLLGGTAAVYASVLQHPSSTLTPLSVLYMLLLAIQYSLQPRFSKKYISPDTSKQSVALVEEIVKTAMAAAVFFAKPNTTSQGWTLSSSLSVAAVPAILYAFQGVLQYKSHQHLDPVTFNGLSQTKTLSAALCCFLILGTKQSPLQLLALVLLFGSSLVFQGNATTGRNREEDSFVLAASIAEVILSDNTPALNHV